MKGLSIIVPFVNEWPQISWTLQALHQDMLHSDMAGLGHEVIAVDNYCKEAEAFGKDRSHNHVESMAKKNDWLVHAPYNKKLSHWQCKNYGASIAKYDTLFFCDAHVLPSLLGLMKMYSFYIKQFDQLSGTVHLPLTYHILERDRLIYGIVDDREKWGLLGYTFNPARKTMEPYEVPVMSTCGMMVAKTLFQKEMIWPEIFGIYGGGENYFNYAMALKGFQKIIFPDATLFHHGEKRGYRYNLPDFAKNRAAAMAIIAGEKTAKKLLYTHKDFVSMPDRMKAFILKTVLEETLEKRLQLIAQQKVELDDFIAHWTM